MTDDLSFKAVCNLIRRQDGKLVETVDAILGPAILLSGLAGAAAGLPDSIAIAGSLLSPKSALAAAGKKLLEKVTAKQAGSATDRFQRMQMAYCLLAYTAFFEALDTIAPPIHEAFNLGQDEKLRLIQSAGKGRTEATARLDVIDEVISLPHPATSVEERDLRSPFYT